jgi:[acyl-carrier-protein] S-malonyltransferase
VGKVAFLFPGQGAQHVGMGRSIAERLPAARQLYEQADEILGFPLSRIWSAWLSSATTIAVRAAGLM